MKAIQTDQLNENGRGRNAEIAGSAPVREAVEAARTDIADRIDSLLSRIGETSRTAREAGSRAVESTRSFVQSNPWQSAGIAAAVGFLIGALVRRR